jgi:hypothetical protein
MLSTEVIRLLSAGRCQNDTLDSVDTLSEVGFFKMTFLKTTVEGSAYLGYNSKFSNDHLQMFDSQSCLTTYGQVASHLGATNHLAHLAVFRSVNANPKFLSPSFFTVH